MEPEPAPPGPAAGAADPHRHLIVRVRNWVGDVVLGLPALRLLEAQGYALHLVARGKWAPALLAGYDWPVSVQPAGLREKVAQLRELRRKCRLLDAGFDRRENALLLPVSLSSALEMRLAGLRAVGFRKEGRSPLLARAVPLATSGHELTRYWALACRFLRLQAEPPANVGLRVAPGRARAAAELLAAHGVMGDYMLICPFAAGQAATAGKPGKKWPEFARFVELAATGLGLPLVVYPGPGEHAQARELYPAAHMIEGSDLSIYIALLQRAALVVANDTGPAHMAAALGSRVISVLGPTNAARWAPWGPGVTVLQHPASAEAGAWPTAEDGLAVARQRLAEPA